MTIQEILTMAELMCPSPSNWTNSVKLTILNEELKEMFRESKIKATETITTVADQEVYALPTGVTTEFIKYVGHTTDTAITTSSKFIEYTYRRSNDLLEFADRTWFDALGGNIGIHPTPDTSSQNIVIIYEKKPIVYTDTPTNLAKTPEIAVDFHRLLVYALVIAIADSGDKPNLKISEVYTAKYNSLYGEYLLNRYDREPSFPKTRDVMKRNNYRTRGGYTSFSDLLTWYTGETVNEVIARNV
jgi:hypothetical protein